MDGGIWKTQPLYYLLLAEGLWCPSPVCLSPLRGWASAGESSHTRDQRSSACTATSAFKPWPVTSPATEGRDGPWGQQHHLSPACQPLIRGVPTARLGTWPHSTSSPRKPFPGPMALPSCAGHTLRSSWKSIPPRSPGQVLIHLSEKLILLKKKKKGKNTESI